MLSSAAALLDDLFEHPEKFCSLMGDYSVGSAPPAHSFTVRSHDALASFIPSGDRVIPRMPPVWALSVLKQRPFDKSQNRIVASSPALMSTLLSGVTASERTQPVWPFSVRCSATWGMSNNLIV